MSCREPPGSAGRALHLSAGDTARCPCGDRLDDQQCGMATDPVRQAGLWAESSGRLFGMAAAIAAAPDEAKRAGKGTALTLC